MAITFDRLMEWIPNVKRFNKNFPIFLLMTSGKNDVINFLKFYTYKAWILRIKIYTTKKTGRYVKDKPYSFQKMKTKLENSALQVLLRFQ